LHFCFLITTVGLEDLAGEIRCSAVCSVCMFFSFLRTVMLEEESSRRIMEIPIVRNSEFKPSFQQFNKFLIPFESFIRQSVSVFISPSCYSCIYCTSTRSSCSANTFSATEILNLDSIEETCWCGLVILLCLDLSVFEQTA